MNHIDNKANQEETMPGPSSAEFRAEVQSDAGADHALAEDFSEESKTTSLNQHIEERTVQWSEERLSLATRQDAGEGSDLNRRIEELDTAYRSDILAIVNQGAAKCSIEDVVQQAQEIQERTLQSIDVPELEDEVVPYQSAAEEVRSLWEEIGECRGRQPSGERVAELLMEWNRLSEDLEKRIVGANVSEVEKEELKRAVLRLVDEAEHLGEVRYLEADKMATALHMAIRAASLYSNQAYEILDRATPEETERAFRVYQEKYQKSFHDAREEAYESKTAKWLNVFRLNAVREILTERFGVGVGLLEGLKRLHPRHWFSNMLHVGWSAIRSTGRVLKNTGESLYRKALRKPPKVVETNDKEAEEKSPTLRGELWRIFTKERDAFLKELLESVKQLESSRTNAILKGDHITAATDSVFLALWDRPLLPKRFSFKKSKAVNIIVGILDKFDSDQIAQIEDDFNKRYAHRFKGAHLRDALDACVTKEEADLVRARMDGNVHKALAIELKISFALKGKGLVEVLKKISVYEPEDWKQVRSEFEEYFDRPLTEDLIRKKAKKFKLSIKGPKADWAVQMLVNHVGGDQEIQARVEASRLRCTLGRGSSEYPESILYAYTKEQNDKILECYKESYGKEFLRDYSKHRRSPDMAKIMSHFLERGELSVAEQVRDCLCGKKADVEHLKRLLSGKTKQELEEITDEYAEKFFTRFGGEPRDLLADISSRSDGFDFLDVTLKLRGTTTEPSELYQQFKDRYAFEHCDEPFMGEKEKIRYLLSEVDSTLEKQIFHKFIDRRNYVEETEKAPIARFVNSTIGAISSRLPWNKKRAEEVEQSTDAVLEQEPSRFVRGAKITGMVAGKTALAPFRVLGFAVRMLSPWDKDIERTKNLDCQRVGEYFEKVIEPRLQNSEEPNADEKRQFQLLVRVAEQSLDQFREMKRTWAQGVANIGEITVAPVATFAVSALSVPFLHAAVSVTGIVFAARFGLNYFNLGEGYGSRQMWREDGMHSGIAGATIGWARWFRQAQAFRHAFQLRQVFAVSSKVALKFQLKKIHKSRVGAFLFKSGESGHSRLQGEREAKEFHEKYGSHLASVRLEQLKRKRYLEPLPSVQSVLST